MRKCSVDGCDRAHVARGYCKKHYDVYFYRNRVRKKLTKELVFEIAFSAKKTKTQISAALESAEEYKKSHRKTCEILHEKPAPCLMCPNIVVAYCMDTGTECIEVKKHYWGGV